MIKDTILGLSLAVISSIISLLSLVVNKGRTNAHPKGKLFLIIDLNAVLRKIEISAVRKLIAHKLVLDVNLTRYAVLFRTFIYYNILK
ncbi:MAG: hypothetical protein K2N27_03590 [Ruminococcus sp.]|nr:hypothetical protein [Ruminococcus sp.]